MMTHPMKAKWPYLIEIVDSEIELDVLGKLFERPGPDVADLVPVQEDFLRLRGDISGNVPEVWLRVEVLVIIRVSFITTHRGHHTHPHN